MGNYIADFKRADEDGQELIEFVLMPRTATEEMLGGLDADPRTMMTGSIAYAHFIAHRPEVPEAVVEIIAVAIFKSDVSHGICDKAWSEESEHDKGLYREDARAVIAALEAGHG